MNFKRFGKTPILHLSVNTSSWCVFFLKISSYFYIFPFTNLLTIKGIIIKVTCRILRLRNLPKYVSTAVNKSDFTAENSNRKNKNCQTTPNKRRSEVNYHRVYLTRKLKRQIPLFGMASENWQITWISLN